MEKGDIVYLARWTFESGHITLRATVVRVGEYDSVVDVERHLTMASQMIGRYIIPAKYGGGNEYLSNAEVYTHPDEAKARRIELQQASMRAKAEEPKAPELISMYGEHDPWYITLGVVLTCMAIGSIIYAGWFVS